MISPSTGALLIDTDVLIDYLRGRPEAVEFLEGTDARLMVSTVTIAELFAGIRGDAEGETLDTFLGAFEAVGVDAEVARAGGRYRARFGSTHGTGLADALIASSAEASAARLVTRNRKHFPMAGDVLTPY